VADQVLMLQYSVYSVISPEGCASILWKTGEKAQEAADAMGITAHRLKALGLVDKIVNEPVGGAHRDTKQMGAFLKRALGDALRQLSDLKPGSCRIVATSAFRAMASLLDTKADNRCNCLLAACAQWLLREPFFFTVDLDGF
jgi:acetyl-CoA carboxylase carboxyl transferase subunit alpha